ncbi:MAG: type II secretion system F family protein [Bacteriovoracales bacterium]|nr:type II secretion system F family protein [Bacteriovoracales bacterium]
MTTWKYVGFNETKKRVEGELIANSEREARRQLRKKGIRPRKLTPPSIFNADLGELIVKLGLSKPFKKIELLDFLRQFGVMNGAGVPILQSFEILFKNQKNPILKKMIGDIAQDIRGGKSFSDSIEGRPGFDQVTINLIRAGELGGALEEMIARIVTFMEKQEKTKKDIKSAMTYPAIVCCVGFGVVTMLLIFVVPKFVDIIKSSGQEVPGVTQFVINVSNLFFDYGFFMLAVGIIGFIALAKYIKTDAGKKIFDTIMMKFPIFGEIVIKGNLSSFSRVLSTMLNSGVSLIDSLDICIEAIDHSIVAKDIQRVRDSVSKGKTITEQISRIPYFPVMVSQMIKIGEQTGELDNMLEKVSNVFEEDVDNAVKNMTKLIEPIIIVVLGGITALILIAMYLPIFMSAGGGN